MTRIGARFVQAPAHGGRVSGPRLIVAHSLECDAKERLAFDLATGWVQHAGVSPHTLSDPGETVGTCDTQTVGFHVGPNGNPISNGAEVTGRAAWSRDKWLAGPAARALDQQARALAEMGLAAGFAPGEYRWLSLAQVGDGRTRGFCYHYDVSRALGGTDHWDPGPGYPADVQMSRIRWYAGVQDHWGLDPATRPDGVLGSGMGGAEPSHELSDHDAGQIRAKVVEIHRVLSEILPLVANTRSTNAQVAHDAVVLQDLARRVDAIGALIHA